MTTSFPKGFHCWAKAQSQVYAPCFHPTEELSGTIAPVCGEDIHPISRVGHVGCTMLPHTKQLLVIQLVASSPVRMYVKSEVYQT